MRFDKRDLVSAGALCAVFIALASWNLGHFRTPRTSWQAPADTSLSIDLGRPTEVAAVYVLVKRGKAALTVHVGSPGTWTDAGQLEARSVYYTWSDPLIVNRVTRFLRLDVRPDPSEGFEATELGLLGIDGGSVIPARIQGDEVSAPGALPSTDWHGMREPSTRTDPEALIDEQDVVRLPPSALVESCFDEVYFVQTAESYLELRTPFEWIHPPLGKLAITLGVAIFGFSPFGWRIPGVILATLMIPIVYALGKKLFGSWIGAFSAAFLFTFDFMHFVLARVATPDTCLVFFSLLAQLCFLSYFSNVLREGWGASRKPLLGGCLCFALACATKWVALFGFAGMLAILLGMCSMGLRRSRNTSPPSGASAESGLLPLATAAHGPGRPLMVLPLYGALAVMVYFLTYVPDLFAGRTPASVAALQFSMYRYHADLGVTHPFAAPWWTWPLMLRPIWLYVEYLAGDMKTTIVLLGNPAVWWIGFPLLLALTAQAVVGFLRAKLRFPPRGFAQLFIVTAFFAQWLPYCLLSRVTFVYHFYACVPFLCLATAYFIDRYWKTKWGRLVVLVLFAVVVGLFALFYPALSGMPARGAYLDGLQWLGADRWEF